MKHNKNKTLQSYYRNNNRDKDILKLLFSASLQKRLSSVARGWFNSSMVFMSFV